MTNLDPSTGTERTPWQPRFGLGSLMLVMMVCSVTAASGYYLVKSTTAQTSRDAVFVIFTLAAPAILLIVVSIVWQLLQLLERRGRKPSTPQDAEQPETSRR